jgi:hypothetical protein
VSWNGGDIRASAVASRTEIDFINGYVAALGTRSRTPVAVNAAIAEIAEIVHTIEEGRIGPDPARLEELHATP